ncbi:MAG TPA: sulfatase-like hydrolase/transferase, partial [Pricia sp.]|nr:sulfatase-like hydrolase/transferase [Pricia sp.]
TPRKEYAAFVSNTDEAIGRVLDYLDLKGLTEDTIVIFQSDHGHSLEERAFWDGGSSGPYRGSKFSMFEGGIRVPAIIRYPKKIPANQVRDQLATGMDWFATIADLSGSHVAENIDGKSLMPIILDEKGESEHDVVHWQLGGYDDRTAQWAVRKGPWKLIGNVREPQGKEGQKADLPKLFLVNLDNDISEQNNLAASHPKKLDALLELHKTWLISVRAEKSK